MKTPIILSLLLLAAAIAPAQNIPGVPDVLLHATYPRGLPRSMAQQVSTNAIPTLVAALRNPAYESSWNNIVAALGFIGDGSSIAPLVSFLRDAQGEQSADAVAGLLAVPRALGDLASRNYPAAVYELAKLCDPIFATTNRFTWTRAGKLGGDLYGADFTRFAVEALGQSRNSNALAVLEELAKRSDVSNPQKYHIAKALKLSQEPLKPDPRDEPTNVPLPATAVANALPPWPSLDVLQTTAVAEFKSIATLILNDNLNEAVPRLVANGAGLVPGHPGNGSPQNQPPQLMAAWAQSLQPTKTILRELDMNGVSFSPLNIVGRTNDTTVLKMVLPNTSNARRHLPEQISNLSLGPANDLAVVMVLDNGHWSWLPFGW